MPVTELVTLDEVKSHLNLTSDDNDEEMVGFIDAATEVVEDLAGPTIQRDVTDTLRGSSGPTVLLSTVPVLSVTSADVSSYGSVSTSYADDDLSFDAVTGQVWVTAGSWWSADVTVVYTVGRSSVPAAVRQATLELVRHMWETQRGSSSGRPTPGMDDTQGFTEPFPPPRVRELLAPYLKAPAVA